jgi:hypothetical protein
MIWCGLMICFLTCRGYVRFACAAVAAPAPQVAGYSGLLLAAPTVLYEIIAYVVPGLTKAERKFLAPIVFGSSILFYIGWVACAACAVMNMCCGGCGCCAQSSICCILSDWRRMCR